MEVDSLSGRPEQATQYDRIVRILRFYGKYWQAEATCRQLTVERGGVFRPPPLSTCHIAMNLVGYQIEEPMTESPITIWSEFDLPDYPGGGHIMKAPGKRQGIT